MLELYKQISETVNQPLEDLRIWSLMNRYNNTIRPLNCYELKELAGRNVLDVCKQESVWNIFVESAGDVSFSLTFDYMSLLNKSPSQANNNQSQHQLSPNSQTQQQQQQKLPTFKPDEEVMIFFKFYEPKTTTLRYVFRMYLSKMVTLVAIQDRINKKMKFPLNTELLFYEEVKISQITPLTNRELPLHKLAHEQLLNGDIYVFQINEKEKLQNYKLPTVTDYFKDLNLQVEVLFCDKNQPNDEGFTLLLSSKMKYDEFAKRVGQHLNYDHEKLQFFRATNASTSSVSSPSSLNSTGNATAYDLKGNQMLNQAIKYNPEFQLKDAFGPLTNKQQFQQHPQQQQSAKKLFYSKLNIKIHELEERRPFKCTWVSSNLKVERELILMPFKKANVKELLGECRGELLKENLINKEQCEDEQNFRLRLVEIVGSRLHRIFREDALIESLDNTQASGNKYYRVEQILPEEFSLINNLNSTNGQDYLLPIAHFSKEIYATFGSPFLLKVKLGEPFKDIKQRIQRKLDINDKEFATYRFALISMGSPTYLPDNDDNVKFELSNMGGIQPWLGIDHKNTANKTKSKFSTMEKAIKIFN